MRNRTLADLDRVVALGGGHGLGRVLSSLSSLGSRLTGIVTTTDNGGSTGRIRRSEGGIAWGDMRNCLNQLITEPSVASAMFEYRFGRLSMGSNIFARSVRGFRTCELYCPKENIGQIKIIRNIPDIPLKTCKVVISVRSESADHIKVRHLNYSDVKKSIYECYNIKV